MGKSGVIDCPIFEELLLGLLKFDDEFLPLFVFTVQIENRFAVVLAIA